MLLMAEPLWRDLPKLDLLDGWLYSQEAIPAIHSQKWRLLLDII